MRLRLPDFFVLVKGFAATLRSFWGRAVFVPSCEWFGWLD